MKSISPYLLLVALCFFLTGCGQKIISQMELVESGLAAERNYELGQMKTTYVGGSLVRIKEAPGEKFKVKRMKASSNFMVSGGYARITGDTKTLYAVTGETVYKGQKFTVVDIAGKGDFISVSGLLVKQDGSVYHKIINQGIVPIVDMTVSPNDLKFTPAEEGYVYNRYMQKMKGNYELVFGGISGDTISIKYREYTPKDLARTAFFQDLVYSIDLKTIRFRNLNIKVHEVSGEKIVFTVLEDGYI